MLPNCIQPVAEESACCRVEDVDEVAAHPPPASLVNAFTLDPRRLRASITLMILPNGASVSERMDNPRSGFLHRFFNSASSAVSLTAFVPK